MFGKILKCIKTFKNKLINIGASLVSNIDYPAIKIDQWQDNWNEVIWEDNKYRRQPNKFFYTLSMSAKDLIRLSDVYERNTDNSETRAGDIGIQRMHNKKRSMKIKEFVKYGYPFCEFNDAVRYERNHMKKPGWLPTGIVVNIIQSPKKSGSVELSVDPKDMVEIEEHPTHPMMATLKLPQKYYEDKDNWKAENLNPIEIIDGQHRLFAFKTEDGKDCIPEAENFYFPVIAFIDLDISWQAYLFWSINVSPEKINASLAYDMYPLLRTEDWLEENPSVHRIYKEARAQEIVETLWSYNDSPWHKKINMLGERGSPFVKQTTWVRAITTNFFKEGGLFQSFPNKRILPWTRPQQAAFLIYFGKCLHKELSLLIENDDSSWPHKLDDNIELITTSIMEKTWSGDKSLLNMDSGIHALCMVINQYFCVDQKFDMLNSWIQEEEFEDTLSNINNVLELLENSNFLYEKMSLKDHIDSLAKKIATFDWRSAKADNLTTEEMTQRKTYRGTGGYTSLRDAIVQHIKE